MRSNPTGKIKAVQCMSISGKISQVFKKTEQVRNISIEREFCYGRVGEKMIEFKLHFSQTQKPTATKTFIFENVHLVFVKSKKPFYWNVNLKCSFLELFIVEPRISLNSLFHYILLRQYIYLIYSSLLGYLL